MAILTKHKSFSDKINQELRRFQNQLLLISLEMQIILSFMDKKRNLLRDLLQILKSEEKEKLLELKQLRKEITDDEYQELKKDLSRDTIARFLSNHRLKQMYSEI